MTTKTTMMRAIRKMSGRKIHLCKSDAENLWMNGYNQPMCEFFPDEKISCIFPEKPEENTLTQIFFSQLDLNDMLPSRKTWARMMMYHETFGHGTEPETLSRETGEHWKDRCKRYNQEFRSDIAAVAGIIRDTKDFGAARAWAAMRDCSSMRNPPFFPAQTYANGSLLRQVVRIIEEKGNDFFTQDDTNLLKFINKTYAQLEISISAMDNRDNMLRMAHDILKNAQNGTVTPQTDENKDAMAYLNDCAESLSMLCKVDARQLWKMPAPKAPVPTPVPQPYPLSNRKPMNPENSITYHPKPSRGEIDLARLAPLLVFNLQKLPERWTPPQNPSAIPQELRAEHMALVDEFRARLAAWPGPRRIILINRADDMDSPESMMRAIGGVVQDGMARWMLDNDSRSMWMHFGRSDFAKAYIHDMTKSIIVFPFAPHVEFMDTIAGLSPTLREGIMPRAEFHRLALAHEVLGHGTEEKFLSPANAELRADIAAIALMALDTGNTRAARTWAAFRDVNAILEIQAEIIEGDGLSEDAGAHANGAILHRVIETIEGMGPAFHSLDDAALPDFVNAQFEKHRLGEQAPDKRIATLLIAVSSILSACTLGNQEKLEAIKAQKPHLVADALALLGDCAKSICHLCKVNAGEIWKTPAPCAVQHKPPAPTPKP
ncbi:MAG TPA: hypothetical protein DCW68_06265 [Rhodospirillaceae bacterium]|nr:MAG: hypothetical protein A2018_03955 [Alphaproteobacteria bacterium GWF2_58_20]HAU29694.1 hypothetical protein [Rhodospirillaceae bacterium]